jgi:hypothetical protein
VRAARSFAGHHETGSGGLALNAVVDEDLRARRRIHGLDRSWLEATLNEWGNWIEEHSDYEGYPRADAIQAWVAGFGGGQRGHRVLCVVMPHRVQAAHLRICNALSEAEREAVWLQYVPCMRQDGRVWEIKERCEIAGVDLQTHQRRLHRAKLRFLGLQVD